MFEKLCNYVPLILLYLAKHFYDTQQPFRYYFTFCGDNDDYLFTCCPVVASDIKNLLSNTHCITKPITNIYYIGICIP